MVNNRPYSFINIAGLAVGLACFLLICLYVVDEISYDRQHAKANRIARVNTDINFGGGNLHIALSSDVMGELLKKDYPEVEQYTRVYTFGAAHLVRKDAAFINETKAAYVDPSFFEVFTMPVLEGQTNNILSEPNTVVVTQSTAQKYFGSTDVVGKHLEIKDGETTVPYKIISVIKDMPANSHFRFDVLYSMKNVNYKWGGVVATNFYTYVLFKEGTNFKAFEKHFPDYINKYVVPFLAQFMPMKDFEEFKKSGNQIVYSLMPLTDIHLYSDRAFELSAGGNIQYLYIFAAVAIFILVIASINFINLTTARSANRAKEVGIRKVLGSQKRELAWQFLVESTVMVTAALLLALLINYFVIDLFNNITGKNIQWQNLFSSYFLPVLIVVLLLAALMAGGYPAFFLSSFKPVQALKGKLNSQGKTVSLRSGLVVFQFVTSIVLIISTVIMYQQLQYIQTKNLGYSKEQVLIINNTGALNNQAGAFKNEVLQLPGVTHGSFSSFFPVTDADHSDNVYFKNASLSATEGFKMENWIIDGSYISTMGMQIIAGRNFTDEQNKDSASVIINETAARILGHSDPLGKYIYSPGSDPNNIARYQIVGVIKNFNYQSLRNKIEPLCFLYGRRTGTALFKLNAANTENAVAAIKNKWSSMAPGIPFSYRFLDDSFNEMYKAEQRAGSVALIFSVLAITIACLGLFGLIAFMAEQRTKEIGIRKVLGAGVRDVVLMLTKGLLKLVTIAALIALPLAWWCMHSWLQNFAYRIHMNWWIFIAAGIIALLIALITVASQAIKAALANPVKSLRTE